MIEPEFDPLEQEFRELERMVLQRECEHDELVVDITQMYDRTRRTMCAVCGKKFDTGEPLYFATPTREET